MLFYNFFQLFWSCCLMLLFDYIIVIFRFFKPALPIAINTHLVIRVYDQETFIVDGVFWQAGK